ncbi:ABC transporter permease [Diaminobutyricimonas sp. TR449]|uniref:ABC transporter permease n=1 Tax=Diaminobutyricimonas sp. TR449 TaxID=2708076 RepID=UPI0014248C83|nr:ABC transporter permease [Diaminobutyricimonas sp. TR449]
MSAAPSSPIKEHGSSILVAVLSSSFGVALLQATGLLGSAIAQDGSASRSASITMLYGLVAMVFFAIAIYVGAIVTVNTFATIVAGRTRVIALYRLVGATAWALRRKVAREGLLVGLVGAILGAAIGTGLVAGGAELAAGAGWMHRVPHDYAQPIILVPVVAVIITTWLASLVGSRRVLTVSPIQATGAATELSFSEATRRPRRNAVAIILFVLGIVLLGVGVGIGMRSSLGVLVGIVGGILSFTGLVHGAHLVMPPALRLAGRLLGSSAPARLAAENALRHPERSSRTTIGLVIGVTLVTTFGVAAATYWQVVVTMEDLEPERYAALEQVVMITIGVFSALIGLSALIAAVGMVNNLSQSVMQRRRELGLLRTLGFTGRQVRQMILAESAQLSVAALLVGLVLGCFYGWAGAQSIFGSIEGIGWIAPSLPWPLLGGLAVATALLTVVASITPSRRATRISPIEALATT